MGLFDLARKTVERMKTKEGTQELIDVERMKACGDIRGLIDILKRKTEETDLVTIVSAQAALADIGEPALEPLLEATKSSSKDAQKNVIGALGHIGEPAFEVLKGMLEQRPGSIQMEVASALGDAGKPGVELLVRILKDGEENKDVRLAAVFGLQTTENKAAIEPLIELLEHKNHWIRAAAVEALATKSHDERAEEALRQTVDNELVDFAVRQRFDDDYSEMLEKDS